MAQALVLLSAGWTLIVLVSVYEGYLGVLGWITGSEAVPSFQGFVERVLLAGGLWPLGLLAAFLHWVALRAIVFQPRPGAHPRRRLVLAAVGMMALSGLSVFTIGLFLLPAAVLLLGSVLVFQPGMISKKSD